MPCESQRKPNQTISERKSEIRDVVARLDKALIAGKVRAIIGPQGAIAFDGLTAANRNGVTDACAYRRLMATGSALAKASIAKAELLAGRQVSTQTVAQGVHSHDGGRHWHGKG